MAYQAKRSKKYVEDFELVDVEGNIKHKQSWKYNGSGLGARNRRRILESSKDA